MSRNDTHLRLLWKKKRQTLPCRSLHSLHLRDLPKPDGKESESASCHEAADNEKRVKQPDLDVVHARAFAVVAGGAVGEENHDDLHLTRPWTKR